jgi:hypothetical protein
MKKFTIFLSLYPGHFVEQHEDVSVQARGHGGHQNFQRQEHCPGEQGGGAETAQDQKGVV